MSSAFESYFFQGAVKGPGLYPAIHRAPQCSSPMLPRGSYPLLTLAAQKQGDLELLSMEEVAAETADKSMGGSRAIFAPEGELTDPTATPPSLEGGVQGQVKVLRHKGAWCSCCTKPGGG
eukprot:1157912-Pelagomonas_calceolata.AAC.1